MDKEIKYVKESTQIVDYTIRYGVTPNKNSIFNIKAKNILNPFGWKNSHLIKSITGIDNQDKSGISTIMAYEGNDRDIWISILDSKEILKKLEEPVSVGHHLDGLVDNDKLLFLSSVDFPRRKLNALVSTYGKVKNITTVRNVDRATKIISNKTATKDFLKNMSSINLVNQYNNRLAINVRYNSNNKFDSQLDPSIKINRTFYADLDSDICLEFKRLNLLYSNEEFLKNYSFIYNTLLRVINDPADFIYGSNAYNTSNLSFDRDLVMYDIENIEVLGRLSGGGVYIDEDYLDIVQKGLKVIDVSKVYAAIGNKVMDYKEFRDIDKIIGDAINASNISVVSMALESLTTFDIDKSILYLSLIFRNAFYIKRYGTNVMNTSVRSLYEHCRNVSKFDQNLSTNEIIKTLYKQNLDITVPLSFLVDESGLKNHINDTRVRLRGSSKINGVFDIDFKVKISIDPQIAEVINMDIDLDDIVNQLNSEFTSVKENEIV
jgi:hypothetical protein